MEKFQGLTVNTSFCSIFADGYPVLNLSPVQAKLLRIHVERSKKVDFSGVSNFLRKMGTVIQDTSEIKVSGHVWQKINEALGIPPYSASPSLVPTLEHLRSIDSDAVASGLCQTARAREPEQWS